MTEQSTDVPIGFKEYQSLHVSIIERIYERKAADAALFRLLAAHAAFRIAELEHSLCACLGPKEIFANHKRIKKKGPDTIDSEYSRDSLILSITLLDSFLTDATRFLFLLRPQALPKDRQVKVADVVRANDYARLVTSIVEKYVQEIAYRSIEDRIGELSDRFGIESENIQRDLEALEPFIERRHTLIHTISQFQYDSAHGGTITVSKQERPVVTWKTAEHVLELVLRIVNTLSRTLSVKLFGREPEVKLPEWKA